MKSSCETTMNITLFTKKCAEAYLNIMSVCMLLIKLTDKLGTVTAPKQLILSCKKHCKSYFFQKFGCQTSP